MEEAYKLQRPNAINQIVKQGFMPMKDQQHLVSITEANPIYV